MDELSPATQRPEVGLGPYVRGALGGVAAAVVATALLIDFWSERTAGAFEAWLIGLVALYYGVVPAAAVGALVGGRTARRRAARATAGARSGKAPHHPVGDAAALVFGGLAAIILVGLASESVRAVRSYLSTMPDARATAVVLIHIGTIVAIGLVGRSVRRRFDTAVAPRDGRPRLLDIALLAVVVGAAGVILTAVGTAVFVEGDAGNLRRGWDAAVAFGAGVALAVAAHALLRRRRALATWLLVTVAICLFVADAVSYVLAPENDPTTFGEGAWSAAILVGIAVHVHRRLAPSLGRFFFVTDEEPTMPGRGSGDM